MGGFLRCTLLALGLLGGLSAHAESPVWALQGAHNTVYLAGSVHLLRADDARLPGAFERAYADADVLVMELDLDDLDPLEAQAWMIERGTFADGTTLRELLGEAPYRRLSSESLRLGLPLDGLQQFEPWAIALTLVQLQYAQLGFDPEQGVERQLQRLARRDGKEILGLETLEEQLGQLDGLSYAEQARFLDLTITQAGDIAGQTQELLDAWRAGDAERLGAMLGEEYARFPSLYRALVSERNQRWLPQLEKLLRADRDYLVVVGALHLVGRDGLLELARQRNWRPVQLP